jgi:putative hydrolase of the HAD superfamily
MADAFSAGAKKPIPPKFLYFDLGNVLLFFSHDRMCRQMAEVLGVEAEAVRRLLFDTPLELDCEFGRTSNEAFYELLCAEFNCRPDYDRLALAGSDIFHVNATMKAVVAQLAASRRRLGLLSNTSDMHWRFFADGRYSLIPDAFECVTLSFRQHRMKPDREIYLEAAEMAGVAPEEIFYVDDVAANVHGAREAGFDAVQYTSTPQYVADLRSRGVEFNY